MHACAGLANLNVLVVFDDQLDSLEVFGCIGPVFGFCGIAENFVPIPTKRRTMTIAETGTAQRQG